MLGRSYLQGVGVGQQVDDLEGVLHDANGHQFLAVVAALHHQRVGQALNNRALGLAETLGGIATGRMRREAGILLLDGNVVLHGGNVGDVVFLNEYSYSALVHRTPMEIRTERDMSFTCTSSQLQRPNSLMSGSSAAATRTTSSSVASPASPDSMASSTGASSNVSKVSNVCSSTSAIVLHKRNNAKRYLKARIYENKRTKWLHTKMQDCGFVLWSFKAWKILNTRGITKQTFLWSP